MDLGAVLWDLFVGRFSGVASGTLGALGSFALAASPVLNLRQRIAETQLASVRSSLSAAAGATMAVALSKDAKDLLRLERRLNLLGVGLLLASFLVLAAGALVSALSPPAAI